VLRSEPHGQHWKLHRPPVAEEEIWRRRWLCKIKRVSCLNMDEIGREVIPTLGGGGVREVADGLLVLPPLGVCCSPWLSTWLIWRKEEE
jgi:hypothetical protein